MPEVRDAAADTGVWQMRRITADTGGELFGWVEGGAGLHGAQAEYVRVPLADATLVRVPAGVGDDAALLVGDVLPTGYHCAASGGVGEGMTVAVVGCGPVGLMAVLGAVDLVKQAIRWCRHGRAPAEFGQRDRQVADDIADATDFAARQGAVFGSEKKNGARTDTNT